MLSFSGFKVCIMWMFKQRVKVSNTQNSNLFFEEEFWVGTGALYSFVPEDQLEKIQIEPVDSRNLILADGRTDRRLLGFCNFEIEGLRGVVPCPIIFAPKVTKDSASWRFSVSTWRHSIREFWS